MPDQTGANRVLQLSRPVPLHAGAAQTGGNVPADGLRRALLGVAPMTARRLLAEQEQEHAMQAATVRAEIEAERARHALLHAEAERLDRRLETLAQQAGLLSAVMQQEAGRAGVTAEVRAQRLAALEQQHAEQTQSLRFEIVRLQADLGRREAEMLLLAEAVYRAVAGAGGLPPGLRLRMPTPAE